MTLLSPLDHLVRVRDAMVHERHGLIAALYEQNGSTEVPGLYVFNAISHNCNYFRHNAPHPGRGMSAGSGAAFNRAAALWSAFGEVAERYAASIYDPMTVNQARADGLGDQAVDLGRCIFFSDAQYETPDFRFHPADRSVMRGWVGAVDLGTARSLLVPATLVYLGADIKDRAEELTQSTSTGLAAGPNAAFAVARALCEIIERDAFASLWQLGFSPPSLVVDPATRERLDPGVRHALEEGPLQIHLWSIPTDLGVATILAMAENRVDGVVAVGASTHPDPVKAIDKAVIEALHGFLWGRQKILSGEILPGEDDDFTDPQEHLAFYLNPKHRPKLDFLFNNTESVRADHLPHLRCDTAGLVDHVTRRGFQVIAKDVTTPDLADLGFCVVRVIVPGLQPLLFGRRLISEDGRRLQQHARFWGVDPLRAYNPAPHPFP